MKALVIGDLHIRQEEPFFSAIRSFMFWLVKEIDEEQSVDTIIFTGDIYHNSNPRTEEIKLALDFFQTLAGKVNRIIVVTGNHDYSRTNGNALNVLKTVDGVEVIDTPTETKILSSSFLLLPYFYDYTYPDMPSMKKEYESDKYKKEYDFIIGHIADETQTLFGEFVDTRHIKGVRIHGHCHRYDSSPNYLGVPVISRYDERGMRPRLGVIIDGKLSYRSIPIFMDYSEITYPEEIPKFVKIPEDQSSFRMWDILDAPSTESAIEKYPGVFIHRVHVRKSHTSVEGDYELSGNNSVMDYFNMFVDEKDIDKSVSDKVKTVIAERG